MSRVAATARLVTPRRAALAGLALAIAAARPAAAHPLDLGYLQITTDGDTVSVALDLHIRTAARLIGADPAALDAAAVSRRADELADASLRSAPIDPGAEPPRSAGPASAPQAPRDPSPADATTGSSRPGRASAPQAAHDPSPADATAASARSGAQPIGASSPRGPDPAAAGAAACRWTSAIATLRDQTVTLTVAAQCPGAIRGLRWALPFLAGPRVSPTFQVLVKARIAGSDHVAIADRTRPALVLAASRAPGLGDFVWTGVEHIGAAPDQWHGRSGWRLPDGLDHILFLVALMLAGGTLVRILGIVSGFTLGHSITLALAALHVVRPPAQLIEPLIALSIALVAAEALVGRFEGHRWKVAAGFGLIHGFGFATALDQLGLSRGALVPALFGYNLGVELGQIAIVLVAAPLILYLQRHRRYHPIVRGLAAMILVAGVVWFFQRL